MTTHCTLYQMDVVGDHSLYTVPDGYFFGYHSLCPVPDGYFFGYHSLYTVSDGCGWLPLIEHFTRWVVIPPCGQCSN